MGDASNGSSVQRVVRPIWVVPPICPRRECSRTLNEAMGPWKERGDWMCHGDHDGKRIWFDYELVMILRARLEAAEENGPNRVFNEPGSHKSSNQ